MKYKVLLLLPLITALAACSGSSSTGGSATSMSAEAQIMSKATTALESASTTSSGLLDGTGYTSSMVTAASRADINPDTDCKASGGPNDGASDYALKIIYCGLMKRPDGPDSVRGGLDRASGFLCALGTIPYDNTPHTVTMTLSTACFSDAFMAIVHSQVCTHGEDPCTVPMTVTGHSSATGVGPSFYEKYFTVSGLSGEVSYTVLIKDTEDVKAAAFMYGQPDALDADVNSTFAVYMNKATGILRYEGRFAGGSSHAHRHIRANLQGTMDSNFNYTDVQTLQYTHGEYYDDNNSAWYLTFAGTPADGRRLFYKSTTDLTAGSVTWNNNTDDNTCVGEAGADCNPETGISVMGKDYFFYGSYTSMKTWFNTLSDIGNAGTIDMDDVWN